MAPLHHQKRVSESIRLALNKDSRITIQCREEYDMPAIFAKIHFQTVVDAVWRPSHWTYCLVVSRYAL